MDAPQPAPAAYKIDETIDENNNNNHQTTASTNNTNISNNNDNTNTNYYHQLQSQSNQSSLISVDQQAASNKMHLMPLGDHQPQQAQVVHLNGHLEFSNHHQQRQLLPPPPPPLDQVKELRASDVAMAPAPVAQVQMHLSQSQSQPHQLQSQQQQVGLQQSNPIQQQSHQQPLPQQPNQTQGPKPRGRRKKIRTEPIRPICPQCEKQFSNQSALTKHKLTHSDERKFACQHCAKAFKRHDHLTGHMQTHSNRKPFNCTIQGCDKTYCDARSLRRHKENIHHIVTPRELSSNGNGSQLSNSSNNHNSHPNSTASNNNIHNNNANTYHHHHHHHHQQQQQQQQHNPHQAQQQNNQPQPLASFSSQNHVQQHQQHNHQPSHLLCRRMQRLNGASGGNMSNEADSQYQAPRLDTLIARRPMGHLGIGSGSAAPLTVGSMGSNLNQLNTGLDNDHQFQYHHNSHHNHQHNHTANINHLHYNNHDHQMQSYSADYASTQHFTFDNLITTSTNDTTTTTPTTATIPPIGQSTLTAPHSADSITDSGLGLNSHYEQQLASPLGVDSSTTPMTPVANNRWPTANGNHLPPIHSAVPTIGHNSNHYNTDHSQHHQMPFSAGYATTQHFTFDQSAIQRQQQVNNNQASGNMSAPRSATSVELKPNMLASSPYGQLQQPPPTPVEPSPLLMNSTQPKSSANPSTPNTQQQTHQHQQYQQQQQQQQPLHQSLQASFSADYASTQHFTYDFNHPMDSSNINTGSQLQSHHTSASGTNNIAAPLSADSITDSGLSLNAHYEQQMTLATPPLVDSTTSTGTSTTNNTTNETTNGTSTRQWTQLGNSMGNISQADSSLSGTGGGGCHLNSAISGLSEIGTASVESGSGYLTPNYINVNGHHSHHHHHQAPYSADYALSGQVHFPFDDIQHY